MFPATEASADSATSQGYYAWALNNTGSVGVEFIFSGNTWLHAGGSTEPAFAINVNAVPEPGVGYLAAAVLGVALLFRRWPRSCGVELLAVLSYEP
jgi:uncharacterized protein (TIGR03382 family)